MDSMEESNDLIKLRRDKLAQLYAKGVNPYINHFKVKNTIGSFSSLPPRPRISGPAHGRPCRKNDPK